jgi:aspartate/methionine/tyrosine aminotransferase
LGSPKARSLPRSPGRLALEAAEVARRLLPTARLLGIIDEKDLDFALRLTREHGVASIPPSAFVYKSAAPAPRFCFAQKDETLEKAADKLRRL